VSREEVLAYARVCNRQRAQITEDELRERSGEMLRNNARSMTSIGNRIVAYPVAFDAVLARFNHRKPTEQIGCTGELRSQRKCS
jgi:hypothetical protein